MNEQTKNHYEIENNLVKLTVFNKKGKAFTALFDLEDLEMVKSAGVWHAQWNKDFNNYMILFCHIIYHLVQSNGFFKSFNR